MKILVWWNIDASFGIKVSPSVDDSIWCYRIEIEFNETIFELNHWKMDELDDFLFIIYYNRIDFLFLGIHYIISIIEIIMPNYNSIQIWTRTRINTNSNSSQRPNQSIIQKFKTARILKIQKTWPNLDQTHHLKQTTMRKQTKKEERKKGNLPKPLPSFSFFGALPAPSSRLKF